MPASSSPAFYVSNWSETDLGRWAVIPSNFGDRFVAADIRPTEAEATARAAELEPIAAPFIAAGLEVVNNGGGCLAWGAHAGDEGPCVMVTPSSGDGLFLEAMDESGTRPDYFIAGVYDSQGDTVEAAECEPSADPATIAERAMDALLAYTFSNELFGELTTAQWAGMRALNASPDYSGDCCASHNFCDANMPMAAAFKAIYGRELDAEDDADCKRWGRAWDLAKRLWFTAPPISAGPPLSMFEAYCAANPGHVSTLTQGELADLREEFEDKAARRAGAVR